MLPTLERLSPSGQPTCPAVGPLDAQLIFLAESPARNEIRDQQPLVGNAGRVFNKALLHTGIRREQVRIINCVPCMPPDGTHYATHRVEDIAWGQARLQQELDALTGTNAILVPMGGVALQTVLGLDNITKWRGSLLPPADSLTGDTYNEYWTLAPGQPPAVSVPGHLAVLPTFHPQAVSYQMAWHIWMLNDLKHVVQFTRGEFFQRRARRWVFSEPGETERLVYDVLLPHEHLVGVDTEIDPPIISLVSEEEVHCFVYEEAVYGEMLRDLMGSSSVLKVAHNMAHDWRMFEKVFGIRVSRPWYDTIGGAHILEPSGFDPGGDRDKTAGEQHVGKSLSPHISSKYTAWPHHKWLEKINPLWYCGVDSIVGYDAYWGQVQELVKQPEKLKLVNFDMQWFEQLFKMQTRGIMVDVREREQVLGELDKSTADMMAHLQRLTQPIMQAAVAEGRVKKVHLWRRDMKCKCCRGASKKMHQCWQCSGFQKAPSKRELVAMYARSIPTGTRPDGWPQKATKAELEATLMDTCQVCNGAGEHQEWLPFNPDSPDQVMGVFYQALGVPARRYMGKITTRIEQLERMLDDGGYLHQPTTKRQVAARKLLEIYSAWNRANNDKVTVSRLTPDLDGAVRCNFDPWYTPTHRVASREGLLDLGTNLQNIPKHARRLLVPRPGYFFIYPDYAQIEGRGIAVLARDQDLMQIYNEGRDSHSEVVKMLAKLGVTVNRQQAKRTFFAGFYGIGEGHLAEILGLDTHTAGRILRALYQAFPSIARYHREVERGLRETRSYVAPEGWTRRWLGYVLEDKGKLRGQVKAKVLKEAIATGPQYIGARIMAEGLMQFASQVDWCYPVAHVHDASLIECPLERAGEAILAAEQHMTVTKWGMRFPVDAVAGRNWYEASLGDEAKLELGLDRWTRDNVVGAGSLAA